MGGRAPTTPQPSFSASPAAATGGGGGGGSATSSPAVPKLKLPDSSLSPPRLPRSPGTPLPFGMPPSLKDHLKQLFDHHDADE